MAEEEQGISFADPESYGRKEEGSISYREILLKQIARLTQLGSVEFIGGYWNKRYKTASGVGIVEEYYVPSTFEGFINGIDVLHDLLYNYFDPEMSKKAGEIETELSALPQKSKEKSIQVKRKLLRELLMLFHRKKQLMADKYLGEI